MLKLPLPVTTPIVLRYDNSYSCFLDSVVPKTYYIHIHRLLSNHSASFHMFVCLLFVLYINLRVLLGVSPVRTHLNTSSSPSNLSSRLQRPSRWSTPFSPDRIPTLACLFLTKHKDFKIHIDSHKMELQLDQTTVFSSLVPLNHFLSLQTGHPQTTHYRP